MKSSIIANCVDMLNFATGFNYTNESYLECGERIWNLIRLFNLRGGMIPPDTIPTRFYHDVFTKGPVKGITIQQDHFQKSLHEYYAIRGWDENGIPTKKKLKQLGLEQYSNILVT